MALLQILCASHRLGDIHTELHNATNISQIWHFLKLTVYIDLSYIDS